MKPAFFASKSEIAKKPPHGAPCNRCGLCCIGTLCPLAAWVFRGDLFPERPYIGPCPALERDEDGFAVCGLVADPGKHALSHTIRAGGREKASAAAKILIGAGDGCDARFNGEPADPEFYIRMIKIAKTQRKAVTAAKKTWGMK